MAVQRFAIMAKKNVTIKDIARKISLHHTTVSRALRDDPSVKPETRAIVLDAARELDYHPNSFAVNLRRRRSNVIGVIVPELHHEFFSYIVAEITRAANDEGYSVLICQSNEDYQQEIRNVSTLMSNRVAGVIAAISQQTFDYEHFTNIENAEVPLIFFDRYCENCNASKVVIDFYGGAYQLVKHLIKLGCKRIAHIGGPKHIPGVVRRLEGYKAALRDYNIPFDDELVVHGGFAPEDGVMATQRFLSLPKRPDAIFAIDDEVAIGAMIRIKTEGLKIPDDIAVAGFDNDKISEFTDPALTTVDIQRKKIGKKAIELLLRQIDTLSETNEPVTETIPTKLIVRESSQRRTEPELAVG